MRVALALLAFAFACSSTRTAWTREPCSQAAFRQEWAACRVEANAVMASCQTGFACGMLVRSTLDNCMVGKGWYTVDVPKDAPSTCGP